MADYTNTPQSDSGRKCITQNLVFFLTIVLSVCRQAIHDTVLGDIRLKRGEAMACAGLRPFEDSGDTHAAANAQGGEAF